MGLHRDSKSIRRYIQHAENPSSILHDSVSIVADIEAQVQCKGFGADPTDSRTEAKHDRWVLREFSGSEYRNFIHAADLGGRSHWKGDSHPCSFSHNALNLDAAFEIGDRLLRDR
jgi:hypothetical protein